ncbi:MAG: DinB family protein [Candidatus Hodarchaeales archaeon]|jgi:uncharacterized damage-inducible protein DinB
MSNTRGEDMNIKNIGDYHLWAGDESRKKLRELTDEDFHKELGQTIGSVREKVIHILLALASCFYNLKFESDLIKGSREETLEAMNSLCMKELLDYWQKYDKEIRTVLMGFSNETVTIPRVNGSSFVLNLNDFYLQYVMHTIYHRGQLNYCLKKLGQDRINADYLFYFDDLDSKK